MTLREAEQKSLVALTKAKKFRALAEDLRRKAYAVRSPGAKLDAIAQRYQAAEAAYHKAWQEHLTALAWIRKLSPRGGKPRAAKLKLCRGCVAAGIDPPAHALPGKRLCRECLRYKEMPGDPGYRRKYGTWVGDKPRAKHGAKLPAGYKIVRRTSVSMGARYDLTAPGGRWLGSHATRAAAVECAVRDASVAKSPRAVKGEIGWDLVSGDLVLERHLPKRMALSRVKAMRAFVSGRKPDWDPDAKRARKPMIRNVGSGAARLIEAAEQLKDAWKK